MVALLLGGSLAIGCHRSPSENENHFQLETLEARRRGCSLGCAVGVVVRKAVVGDWRTARRSRRRARGRQSRVSRSRDRDRRGRAMHPRGASKRNLGIFKAPGSGAEGVRTRQEARKTLRFSSRNVSRSGWKRGRLDIGVQSSREGRVQVGRGNGALIGAEATSPSSPRSPRRRDAATSDHEATRCVGRVVPLGLGIARLARRSVLGRARL